MENSKNSKIISEIAKIKDIRQTKKWAEYLSSLGWESITTQNGTNMEFIKMPFGNVCKVQRPKVIDANDLQNIENICKEKKSMFVKIEPNLLQDLSIFEQNEYDESKATLSPPSTLFINLKNNENNLWNDISDSGKYSIKRAVREKTKVEFIKNPSDKDLEKLQSLIETSSKKKKFRSMGYKDLVKKRDLWQNECFVIFSYDKDKNLCGGKFYLGHENCVWYMHGGTSEIGRNNKAGYEMVWQSFLHLKRKGYEWLDFEGVDDDRVPQTLKQWGGFSHFKEKFGGERIEYPLPQVKYFNKVFGWLSKKSVIPA